MFHHFHDEKKHKKSQGSISRDEFYKIIKFIGKKNILNADSFFQMLKEKKLKSNHVCLTFDDAIKGQIDIALPVLEDLKIKSFFFVYSSIFEKKPDFLEINRFFRHQFYKKIDKFYEDFYKTLGIKLERFFFKNKQLIISKKKKFPFYSLEDIKFRLVKNHLIKNKDYEEIMKILFKKKNFIPQKFFKKLFFSKRDLKRLNSLGHTIGLHSHSHTQLIEKLSYNQQKKEYLTNLKFLSKILKKNQKNFKTMSHPCGSYNHDTLTLLKKLGIELGFKQIMSIEKTRGMNKINNSALEIARQDHTKILKVI